jgi:transposase
LSKSGNRAGGRPPARFPFYPKEVEIQRIIETEDAIQLYLKSHTRKQRCPKCDQASEVYHHSTYTRKLQDLPILGKRTEVYLKAYRYYCHTEGCDQKVFSETINDFCGTYKRMTGRLEDFMLVLVSQTSCEGAARVCAQLGIKVSGDTIIRIFLKRAEAIKPSIQKQVLSGLMIGPIKKDILTERFSLTAGLINR